MKPKLIICIDGLGYDLISKQSTPFLYDFGKKNSFFRLKTLFAFTGIEYTFFTGKTPDQTGIWLEFVKTSNSIFKSRALWLFSFNKKARNYVGALLQLLKRRTWLSGLQNLPQEMLQYFDTGVKRGLWELEVFQKRDFAFYKWPFFVTKKDNHQKRQIIFRYESDDKRLRRLLRSKKKAIYYTQLMSIDKTIHKFGKKSRETERALKRIDNIIERYVTNFLSENDNADIFIWSDHGFADIKEYIDIEKILPKGNYLYFIAGTTVSFWFQNEDTKKQVLEALSLIKEGRMLDARIAEKYKIPLSSQYGEIVFFIDKGNYFFPNFYQREFSEKFVAMHGYPQDYELDGIFITNKKTRDLELHEIVGVLEE